jgi:hypothetical protein
MKILVKNDFISNTQSILNIFHIDDDDYIEKWINEYIQEEIKSKNTCKEISYEIQSNFTEFSLIQKHKIINKGYIYNSNTHNYTKLFTININTFIENITDTCVSLQKNLPYTKLYNDINEEINKRITKELNQETLLLLQSEYNKKIQTKNTWTQKELILLQNTIIKKHEIQLFNNISKQLRKNNRKQKRNTFNADYVNRQSNSQNLVLKSCKEEYITVSCQNQF